MNTMASMVRQLAVAVVGLVAGPLMAAGPQPAGRAPDKAASVSVSAQTSLRIASTRHEAGDTDAAIQLLERHLATDGDAMAVRRALVAMLVSRSRFDKAVEVLGEGMRRDPRDAELTTVMSNLLVRAGDSTLAIKLLEGASGDGAAPAVNAQLARLLMQTGKPAEAVNYWVKALGQGGGAPDWWLGLALALDVQGRSAEAREAFSRALQSGGRIPPAAVDYARMRLAALD